MSDTAERLLDLAEARIRDAGYGGFSFRDLASEIGIKSASVHHHFPTKGAMAAAVAKRYGERFFEIVSASGLKQEDAISVYREAFRAALGRDGKMCLCGILGAEAGVLAPEVAREIETFFRRCVDDLANRIGGPGSEHKAFHVMATLEGGMMLARACKSIDAFDQAAAPLANSNDDPTS